ncbi:asparagine synthase-related protein [Plantactinospora sp. GCM10030261]|uniref:asparagine synthase-related protein n=1 Tax=Plantactinospora sp. GCM10030261 TaxID=3273420 RepID=UPI003614C605
MTEPNVPRPTAREIAIGMVLDPPDTIARLPDPSSRDPLTALERAMLPALTRPPCVVSFSGGLDSSLILALAVRMARANGLADPVPVTMRFSDAPAADESDWQDAVVRALDIAGRWHVVTFDDELDIVGPVAQRVLHRYGVLYPHNLHGSLPAIDLARGGSVLTGIGGDQMLLGLPRPASHDRRSGALRALARLRRLPAALRRRMSGGARPGAAAATFEWLRPAVADQARAVWAAARQAEPDRLDQRILWHLGRRDLRLCLAALGAVGADYDVVMNHPLLDPVFLAALIARDGYRHRPTRDELLSRIVGDTLPAVVTAPRRKAKYHEAYRRRHTRDFLRSWDGTGMDLEFVDPVALRRIWSRWPVPATSSMLIQHLWLAAHPESSVRRRVPAAIPRPVPPTGLETSR